MLRVHRIPRSTNVERIAIAAGLKGLEVAWVDHDPVDRSGLVAVSGQPLAPVAELPDGRVVNDSPRILRELELLAPEPPLWPADPVQRAVADVLVEWFDEAYKPAPNRLADGEGRPGDEELVRARTERIEALLGDGRDWLLATPSPTVADVVVLPFAAYWGADLEPEDDDPFHAVLAAQPAGPRTRAWVGRGAAVPRA